jgi:hypothetical protein
LFQYPTGQDATGPTNTTFPGGVTQDLAIEFTVSSATPLAQIDLALAASSGTPTATVVLAGNNGGIPGSEIGAWTVNVPGFSAITNNDYSSNPYGANLGTTLTTISLNSTLNPGNYWLEVLPGASNSAIEWFDAGTSTPFNESNYDSANTPARWISSAQSDPYAFDVLSTSTVPLPAAAWLLSSGLVGLGTLRRKRLAA